jgi:hypothetical protein
MVLGYESTTKCSVYAFLQKHTNNNNNNNNNNNTMLRSKKILANIHILHRIVFHELIKGEIAFLQQHQRTKIETLHVWFIFGSNENIITNVENAKNIETNEIH